MFIQTLGTKLMSIENLVTKLQLSIQHLNIWCKFETYALKHKAAYPDIYEMLLLDLEELRTFTFDEESFFVLEPLWERKWTEEFDYPDEKSKELVIDFIVYFKREWVQPELVRGWYHYVRTQTMDWSGNIQKL